MGYKKTHNGSEKLMLKRVTDKKFQKSKEKMKYYRIEVRILDMVGPYTEEGEGKERDGKNKQWETEL